MHFWSFWAKCWHFCPFRPMPDKKTMRTRCLGGFSVIWVTKLLISPVKIRIFAQKRPNLARNLHFCPLLAHWCPVGGMVGGCVARAVPRKTPIYFMPFETNVMIWFQYVFHCNIEAGRNFETYIASTFGIEPSSSTNVTGWELVTHYSLKSLLSTERQIQFMQILPSGTKTKLNEEFPWAQKNLIQNSEYHENDGPT